MFDALSIVTIENMGPTISNLSNLTFFLKLTTYRRISHTIVENNWHSWVRYSTLLLHISDTIVSKNWHSWVGYSALLGQIFDTMVSRIYDFWGVEYSMALLKFLDCHYFQWLLSDTSIWNVRWRQISGSNRVVFQLHCDFQSLTLCRDLLLHQWLFDMRYQHCNETFFMLNIAHL